MKRQVSFSSPRKVSFLREFKESLALEDTFSCYIPKKRLGKIANVQFTVFPGEFSRAVASRVV